MISLAENQQELLQAKQEDLLHSDSNAITHQDSRMIMKLQASWTKLWQRKIVIDVREFRSSLPLLLHHQQFHLIPRTLTIGDYVIATEIAIERKGISDLYQSFASGRLYQQIEQMSKYYQYPMLLIEFGIDKSFGLVVSLMIPILILHIYININLIINDLF